LGNTETFKEWQKWLAAAANDPDDIAAPMDQYDRWRDMGGILPLAELEIEDRPAPIAMRAPAAAIRPPRIEATVTMDAPVTMGVSSAINAPPPKDQLFVIQEPAQVEQKEPELVDLIEYS